MKSKAASAKQAKPSKAFVKEMERMYPKGAVITPKKVATKATVRSKK